MNIFKNFQNSISRFAFLEPTIRFELIKLILDKIVADKKLVMKGTYLDLGCAGGYASLALCSKFSEIVNLDVSKRFVENSKHNCRSMGVHAHFVVADALNLPFRKASFNVISAFSLVEHLENQFAFLKEIYEALDKKGMLLMQYPNGAFFIEIHTGMPLPNIFPRKLFEIYFKYVLKRGESPRIWNLTRKEAFDLCNSLFDRTYIEKCNYTETVVPSNLRITYKLLKLLKILDVCPLGWVSICIKEM